MGLPIDCKTSTAIVERTENIDRFFHDVVKFEPLTQEEELALFSQVRNGTPEESKRAKDEIVKHNIKFIISVAKKYSNKDNLLDTVNELVEALIECIDKFDPERGNRFITMAVHYLRLKLNTYRTTTAEIVKQTNKTKTFHCISRVKNELIQKLERNPTDEELKDRINELYGKEIRDAADIIDIKYCAIDYGSGDAFDDTDVNDIYDYNKATTSVNSYEHLSDVEHKKKVIESMLSTISGRERKILELSFGLCSESGFQKEYQDMEIADMLGLTKERVRQLKQSALKKLGKRHRKLLSGLL